MFKHFCTGTVIAALVCVAGAAGAQQCCGDCNGNNEVSIDELIKAVNRSLDGCQDDGVCSQPGGQHFPASGQTTPYGPGSDGDVRAGAALSYTDNGDGTITDNNTGLMWEKKDWSGSIHDWGNKYTWGANPNPSDAIPMNGTMVTEFLAALNTSPCFAGHCDWRIPNVKELHSTINYEVVYAAAVSGAFSTGCVAGCTVDGHGGPLCSCTAGWTGDEHAKGVPYWSSTAHTWTDAWGVSFAGGRVDEHDKGDANYVRAVRGGL